MKLLTYCKSINFRFGAFIGFAIIVGVNYLLYLIADPVYGDRFVFDNDYQAGFPFVMYTSGTASRVSGWELSGFVGNLCFGLGVALISGFMFYYIGSRIRSGGTD